MVNRYKLPKYTSPESNMATQKMPSEKEISLPTTNFQFPGLGIIVICPDILLR